VNSESHRERRSNHTMRTEDLRVGSPLSHPFHGFEITSAARTFVFISVAMSESQHHRPRTLVFVSVVMSESQHRTPRTFGFISLLAAVASESNCQRVGRLRLLFNNYRRDCHQVVNRLPVGCQEMVTRVLKAMSQYGQLDNPAGVVSKYKISDDDD
jgi:hypothetical protein